MRQRLRAYENEGIQASLDMQSAARAVAAENRSLRILLARHGVVGEAVDEFLRNNGVDQTTTPSADTHVVTINTPLQTVDSSSVSPISPSDTGSDPPPGTHMDCDIAASIVADLHGHGDHNLARTTLGCTTRSCSVKTTRVFSIIDSAT